MIEVKCVGLQAASLPSGRLLKPGHKAEVDPVDVGIQQQIDSGQLVPTVAAELEGDTIAQILDRVDGDPDKAAEALAAEQSRPEPRATLLKKLETIVNTQEKTA